jgi:hypothetical protein
LHEWSPGMSYARFLERASSTATGDRGLNSRRASSAASPQPREAVHEPLAHLGRDMGVARLHRAVLVAHPLVHQRWWRTQLHECLVRVPQAVWGQASRLVRNRIARPSGSLTVPYLPKVEQRGPQLATRWCQGVFASVAPPSGSHWSG